MSLELPLKDSEYSIAALALVVGGFDHRPILLRLSTAIKELIPRMRASSHPILTPGDAQDRDSGNTRVNSTLWKSLE